MQISAETSSDETSDAVKKVILNFLQLTSLSSSLPLQWPSALESMFETFSTMSSAGSALLIPDCELTNLKTSDAFYYKQIFFTFLLPIIFIICIVVWSTIKICCGHKFKRGKITDYCILSIVLMFFLCYPLLTKMTLSMLKCPLIGEKFYLMADLQEECFQNDHLFYVWLLSVPQIIVYIVGLPVAGFLLLKRNMDRLHNPKFYTRYGLLYLGYRDERAWWEVVVAFRKVTVVLLGTFGTILGSVDIQALLAVFLVFLSIVLHLVGKPFDMERDNTRRLHNLEFTALTVCFCTFWGGLFFFLSENSVSKDMTIFVTVILVILNVIFLVMAIAVYCQEHVRDRKHAAERKSSSLNLSAINATTVVPINDGNNEGSANESNNQPNNEQQQQEEEEEEEEEDGNNNDQDDQSNNNVGEGEEKVIEEKVVEEIQPVSSPSPVEEEVRYQPVQNQEELNNTNSIEKLQRIRTLSFTPANHLGNFGDHIEARTIHDEFQMHEEGLRNRTEERQKRARRKTQVRLKARTRLKDSKALHKLKIFADLDDAEVDLIIDKMDHIVRFEGHEICHQHDVSDSFYIIVKGHAIVNVDEVDENEKDEEGDENEDDDEEEQQKIGCRSVALTCPEQVQVATIDTLGFFGEAALLEHGERTATVVVASDRCDLLRLTRTNFLKIMALDEHAFKDKHHGHKSIIEQMKETTIDRSKRNRTFLKRRKTENNLNINESIGSGGGATTTTTIPVPPLPPPKLNLNGLKSTSERSLFS